MAKAESGPDHDIDVRTQMRIALFWRGLIGDSEYIKFNPEDLLRWYMALELLGPVDIRDVLTERYSTRPVPSMLGIVSKAPHPPLWIVREWLQFHEQKVSTGGYWWAAVSFPVLCLITMPFLHGCIGLTPINPLAMNPPNTSPQVTTTSSNVPTYGASPSIAPAPVFQPSVTATGPQSNGIAGGTSGAVPAAGATGPTNSGASAGISAGGPGQP